MTGLFLSVLGTSVSISLIVPVLIFLAPFLNKRYASKWKYMIWIFLALWLLVPLGEARGQLVTDLLPQTEPQKTAELEAASEALPSRRMVVELPAQMTAPIPIQPGESNSGISPLDLAAFVWMLGVLIFLSIHLFSYFHYRRQVMKRGRIIKDARILKQIFRRKQELHIRCTLRAVEDPRAESPMMIGFLSPVLVLPKEEYRPKELFFVVKHELIHLKRKDVYWKLLFLTANAVHWFNPLIWIMQKEAAVDMELSCDERVTQGADYKMRKAYTKTLMSMLHRQYDKKTLLSTQFYGGTKIMKTRFQNILIKNRKKNGFFI